MLNIDAQKKKDIIIISLNGEMVFNELEEADRFFMAKLGEKPRIIAIDCKQLHTLDSSGLGMLIRFSKEAVKAGVKLVILDIIDQISALFDVSKLDAIFEIMTSDEFKKTYPV